MERADWGSDGEWGIDDGLEFIQAADRNDHIVYNAAGEYLKVLVDESGEPMISAAWSIRLDTLHDLLTQITEQAGIPADERYAILLMKDQADSSNIAAQEALDLALANPESVCSIMVDFDTFSVSWSQNQEYGDYDRVDMGESTIVVYKKELELLRSAVAATATNTIGKNISGILHRIIQA